MKRWILLKKGRHSNNPVNSNMFKMISLDLAKPLGFDDFLASEVWLGQWEKRFSVSFIHKSLEVFTSKFL